MKLQIIITALLISFLPAKSMDQQSKQPLSRLALQQTSMETSSRLPEDRAQARKQWHASHTATTTNPREQEQLDREARIISRVGAAVFFGSLAVVAYGLLAATHTS